MATELYDLTVPVFTRALKALSGLLDKAVVHAGEAGAEAVEAGAAEEAAAVMEAFAARH